MPTLGEIVTRYTADISGFSSAIARMEQQATAFDRSMGQHVSNFQSHMSHIPSSMSRASSSIQTTTGHVNAFGRTVAQTASQSSGHVDRISSRVTSSFGGIGRSILGTVGMLGGWGLAIGAAVGGVTALGGALLKSNADMEQTEIAFRGLMGSTQAASQMMKDLQAFAAKTPFEFPELAEDARMLMGMGVAAKDVIPWMTAIGDAAAGVGRGAEGAQRVTIALGQMQARGKISGEEMMQLTEAGIPAWKILAQSMGLSVAQVQDLSQKGELGQDAINKLVGGMEKMYGGQMKNQATTFNGLLSTLKDNAGMALRAFTGPLFEAAKGGLQKLTEFLGSPAFQSFASGAAKWIADAFQKIGQFVGPVVSEIGSFISSLMSGNGPASQFGGILQQVAGLFAGNFLNVIQQVAGFVTGSLIPAIQGLMPTFSRIGDLFVTTIIPAFLQIWPVVNQVASVIRQVFLAAISALLPVIVNLANFLSSLIVPAFKFLAPYVVMAAKEVGKFAQQVGTTVIPIIQGFALVLGNIVNWVKNTFIAIWPTIGPIVGNAFQVVVTIIKTAWSIITGLFSIFSNLIKGNWSGAWNALKDMLGNIWSGITGIIGNALGAIIGLIKAILGGVFNAITTPFVNAWNFITGKQDETKIKMGIQADQLKLDQTTKAMQTAQAVVDQGKMQREGVIRELLATKDPAKRAQLEMKLNAINQKIEEAQKTVDEERKKKDGILQHQADLKRQAEENNKNIFQKAVDWAGRMKDEVVKKWDQLKQAAGEVFRGIINWIIDRLNDGIRAIQNFVNFFVDKINSVSQFFLKKDIIGRVGLQLIPHLARGDKDFAGGLAMVGEAGRELVYLPQHSRVLPNEETERLIRIGQVPVPHFEGGTGGGIGDILGNVIGWMTGGVEKIVSGLFSGAPNLGFLGDIAGSLLSKVAGWVKDWLGSLFNTSGNWSLPAMHQVGNFILPPGGGFHAGMWYGIHQGMDFAFPQGSPLHEVIGGRVMPATGWYPWGGEAVVQIPGGLWERYLHMSAIFAQAGQMVKRGDLLGLTGGGTPASGLGYWSTGAHLHIQYSPPGSYTGINPLDVWSAFGIFKPFGKGGKINEKILGTGMRTGQPYILGEGGSEMITPVSQQSRIIELLERIERVLVGTGPISDWQVQEALGKLLARGVRL